MESHILWLLATLTLISSVNAENENSSTALVVRHKRAIYYLCGTPPRQYFSRFPCYRATNSLCENGGRKLGTGCTIANQCVAYYRGPVSCIRNCCCTVPQATVLPTAVPNPVVYDPVTGRPTIVPPGGLVVRDSVNGICPNGDASSTRCSSRGQCGTGQRCMSGLCCVSRNNDYTLACGGQLAIAPCSAGTCTGGYTCTSSDFCCPCPVGRSGGTCGRSRLCAAGYTCHANGHCCASCPGNATPYGMCRNGSCGGGRVCRTGNICC